MHFYTLCLLSNESQTAQQRCWLQESYIWISECQTPSTRSVCRSASLAKQSARLDTIGELYIVYNTHNLAIQEQPHIMGQPLWWYRRNNSICTTATETGRGRDCLRLS
jgi:hypothetical protein